MDDALLIAIIAVSGTLASALISTLGMYFIEDVRHKRENEREREKDKTKIRRDIIKKIGFDRRSC